MSRVVGRRFVAVLAVALGSTLCTAGTAQAATPDSAGLAPATTDPSPAGCTIKYVDWPHFAQSVPGAVKVNAKSQCKAPGSRDNLSVTLLADGKPVKKTTTKNSDKAYLMNEDTWVMCTNTTDRHTFKGIAMGTSFENDKPYIQIKEGAERVLACGISED